MPQSVSATEAAHMLGITRQRVHVLIREGKLYAVRVYGMWRIPTAEVERRQQERAAQPVEG